MMKQLSQYIHVPEEEEIGFLERAYQVREERLDYSGREILYLVAGCTGFTCCDRSYTTHLETIRVIGYIIRWRYDTNEKGEAVSEVEPVEDKETQQKITQVLRKKHTGNISF